MRETFLFFEHAAIRSTCLSTSGRSSVCNFTAEGMVGKKLENHCLGGEREWRRGCDANRWEKREKKIEW